MIKLRRAYVIEVLDLPNTERVFKPAIEALWNRIKTPSNPPSFSTVYRWKKAYSESSSDIRSLIKNEAAKGNRTRRYPKLVIDLCRSAIEARFLTKQRNSIQDTLDEAVLRVLDENKVRLTSEALRLPTRRLITRLIKEIPAREKYAARHGQEAARRVFRSVKGHVHVEEPLQRAEIDHTVLDLFVLDERANLPLGRPYVTACIDAFTRCILGIHISFTPPSFATVKECLKDCFRPKVDLKTNYPRINSDWPAFGIMRELVLDNGREFHSDSLEQACYSLGIGMTYAPRRTPWSKPIIERFFGTLARGFAHSLPGTTFQNIFQKEDYEAAKHAIVTLSDLQEKIREWIVDVYHQEKHRGLGTTPHLMWTTNILSGDMRFPDDTIDLDVVLGRVERRVLSHKGIELGGLSYNSPELLELRNLHGTKIDVDIRVNDSDLGAIYVLPPGGLRPISVPALDQAYARGISTWQHGVFKNWQKGNAGLSADSRGWLHAKREIQQWVEEQLKSKRGKSGKRLGRFAEDMSRGTKRAISGPEALPIKPDSEPNRSAHLSMDLATQIPRVASPNSDVSFNRDLAIPRFKSYSKSRGRSE